MKEGDLMAPTEAQKRASAKYQRENIANVQPELFLLKCRYICRKTALFQTNRTAFRGAEGGI